MSTPVATLLRDMLYERARKGLDKPALIRMPRALLDRLVDELRPLLRTTAGALPPGTARFEGIDIEIAE